ncbi:MAG: SdpI family protein [Alphaproteobacteria bacterium]|nr:SdpI family protein [Alphaproteobacteria bacterium SS10]
MGKWKLGLWINLVILVSMVGFSIYLISVLPADTAVPIHWNALGEVDGYASPLFSFLVMPVVVILTSALILIIPTLEKRKENLAQSFGLLQVTWVATTTLLAVIHFGLGLIAMGVAVPMMKLVFCSVGLLFAVVGNLFGKARSNHHLGFRTPWTLSSDAVWDKTHRLAGRLWVAGGLLVAAIGLTVQGIVPTIIMILIMTVVSVVPLVASYLYSKREQSGANA